MSNSGLLVLSIKHKTIVCFTEMTVSGWAGAFTLNDVKSFSQLRFPVERSKSSSQCEKTLRWGSGWEPFFAGSTPASQPRSSDLTLIPTALISGASVISQTLKQVCLRPSSLMHRRCGPNHSFMVEQNVRTWPKRRTKNDVTGFKPLKSRYASINISNLN